MEIVCFFAKQAGSILTPVGLHGSTLAGVRPLWSDSLTEVHCQVQAWRAFQIALSPMMAVCQESFGIVSNDSTKVDLVEATGAAIDSLRA